ncbi:hypothetical protein DEI81_12395 [Curtobacterium sp. MCBD17_013]|uniref:hypothetical protein n=1 Tax=Curtobacterium sp. MCBD17_013 TaxID=2175668 RepID=UPI000DA9CED2|nr:hypothetical protein [Curtobacterium sp. MCBD17_013]PZF60608.1 hypothetical protein DEI81_12395 [Curtobacterium sp. MCBD17_013]
MERRWTSFFRSPYVPRSQKIGIASLGSVLVVLAIGLPALGITSHELGQRHTTQTCTITAVDPAPLRSGGAAWDVGTDCGGTIDIDPSAAGQSLTKATALARSLDVGHRYRLTLRGVLHTAFGFSTELLRATPVP